MDNVDKQSVIDGLKELKKDIDETISKLVHARSENDKDAEAKALWNLEVFATCTVQDLSVAIKFLENLK